jgi:hypothetical protein
MSVAAPYSALNQFNSKPVGGVVNKSSTTPVTKTTTKPGEPSAIDKLPGIAGQNEFGAEQKLYRKMADNFIMAQANARIEKASIYTMYSDKNAASVAMQNVLYNKYLPTT